MTPFKCFAVFDDPENGLRGNIAAVIEASGPVPESVMQRVAADLNQPATTFLWPGEEANSFHVRWFAPDQEIGLCGHGSLAAVACLGRRITLQAGNARIGGAAQGDDFATMELDPIAVTAQTEPPVGLSAALGVGIEGYFRTTNKDIVLLDSEQTLVQMRPDFEAMKRISVFGYAVTAPGRQSDFVSRTLVPHVRQLEDHATGSSHAALTPFWSERLGKKSLTAIQRSPRGGRFQCGLSEGKVSLGGHYTLIVQGEVNL